MAMLRLARQQQTADLIRLVVSVRRPEDLYYADELPGPETTVIYTRAAPAASARPPGRLTEGDLSGFGSAATTYICGSSPFADAATDLSLKIGVPAERIRIERFGPTG
jgi:ferredoxin-NADP reductase